MVVDLAPISVVITTCNDSEYLCQAIESVLEQTLLPKEVIVVDDGSYDREAENIVEKYAFNNMNVDVLFFRKNNGGASSARNLGLKESRQKYLAFLDVDDRMLPNNLKDKFDVVLGLDERYFGVYGGAIRSTGGEEVFASIDGSVNTDLIDKKGVGIPGGVPFYLFNKEAVVDVGGFDEKLSSNEDYDLIIRLLRSCRKCKGSAVAGFYRNLRKGSLSRPLDPVEKFNGVMRFLDKAEMNNYYSLPFLSYRRVDVHLALAKDFFYRKKLIYAFKLARRAFWYGKPFTLKQKVVYVVSLSFLNF